MARGYSLWRVLRSMEIENVDTHNLECVSILLLLTVIVLYVWLGDVRCPSGCACCCVCFTTVITVGIESCRWVTYAMHIASRQATMSTMTAYSPVTSMLAPTHPPTVLSQARLLSPAFIGVGHCVSSLHSSESEVVSLWRGTQLSKCRHCLQVLDRQSTLR